MTMLDVEQGSPEWLAARAGSLGASQIGDVMAKTKTGYSASRANMHARMVAERLTGAPSETFVNAAMQWGKDTEPQARAMYSLTTGQTVEEVGLFLHPDIAGTHASPDGLVGARGLLEIKCPGTAVHIASLTGASIDRKYLLQMQWQMACADREWCDFASFDPRMPDEMQLHVTRVRRDNDFLDEIEDEVCKFLAEVDATVAQLTSLYLAEAA